MSDATEKVYNLDDGGVTMVLDSGCRRSVAGPRWHATIQKACSEVGLVPVKRGVNETFKFGDGDGIVAQNAYA